MTSSGRRASRPALTRRGLLSAASLAGLAACTSGEDAPPSTAPSMPGPPHRTAHPLRPAYHFSPPGGNLADPNGLVRFDGEYHLFHQADGSWSHAVSTDRWHWRDLPTALPASPDNLSLSGSAVVDEHDSTGLFDGDAGLVAIYTSTAAGEAQSIATSRDGRTFRPYDANPVLPNGGRHDFRDPKVRWHEPTRRWVMVVAQGDYVGFYGSPDLLRWEPLSEFGAGMGLHSAVWECPDLFPLPLDGEAEQERWVLHVSVGDSDATAGSTAQWFVGSFDGTTFLRDGDPTAVDLTDFGQDFYAAQTWSDPDGTPTWLGWMSNWRYPYQAPTPGWQGAMSAPRQLALETRHGRTRLVQRPIDTTPLRRASRSWPGFEVTGTERLDHRGTAYELIAQVSWDDVDEVGVRVRTGRTNGVATGFRPADGTVFLDRTGTGSDRMPTRAGGYVSFGRRTAAMGDTGNTGPVEMRLLVDNSSVEVFLDDGLLAGTNLVFTDASEDGIELYADGGSLAVHSLEIHDLEAVWRS